MSPSGSKIESPKMTGEIVEPTPFPGHLRALTAIQRIAFYIAIALFVLIAATVVMIVIDWWAHGPVAPTLTGLNADAQKTALEGYKTLSDIASDRATKLFETIIVKALLPVFLTVVGFLLGHRESS